MRQVKKLLFYFDKSSPRQANFQTPNFLISLSLAIDRTSLVQKLKGNYATFDELTNALLGKTLMEESQWKHIDLIFN